MLIKFKKNKKVFITFFLVIICWMLSIFLYKYFIDPEGLNVYSLVETNPLKYYIIIISLRILGIVFSPFPGQLFTLSSIPIIGWQYSYLLDLVSSMLGSILVYLLGLKYGMSLISFLLDDSLIAKVQKINVKKNKQIKSLFLLRLSTGVLIDTASYIFGLIGINKKNFIIGTFVYHVTVHLVIFYFGNTIINGNKIFNLILVCISLIFCVFIYKYRKKIFE